MNSVMRFSNKKITQFESKQTPTIQQEKNIIKKNNIGTVVPGDALRNINLSTVPSVIEDAINQMALSVESKVLANALLFQIQRDIENLGDAIVEKNYIDGQVTYLTNIVNQKSDKGDVASIVDSKLAIVTPTLATANQVIHLSSRLDESQSSINEVKQTINTEKEALISMIEEAEAKVDENLSNYSAVLNLTVDGNGNIVSQKLESLISQNNNLRISIDELEETMLDEFGNWSAKVAKFITDNNGNITGFSFANGSGQTSKFKINADNFQISNSSNSYVPFKIEGNNLIFNGKVTFSNITGGDSIITKENIQNAVNNNVTTIDGGKIVTNQAFVNNLNAVGGVTADTINGNTLNGIVINGARINGSVIKASYLDLDGELEVLTNYHITVAMYNANPSLYIDAVYISADNEYRIPSISNISSIEKIKDMSGAGTHKLSSGLFSYATANVGHNNKAVKVKPTIIFYKCNHISYGLSENMVLQLSHTSTSGNGTFSFFIGDLLLIRIITSGNLDSATISYTGLVGSGSISNSDGITDKALSYNGINFTLRSSKYKNMDSRGNSVLLFINGDSTVNLDSNWISGEIYMMSKNSGGLLSMFRLPAISINNMI
ncbi:hypothetical protein [Aliarcobacter butzleri]|uniref:hypothetical protein n=1 Tax=Aliarcobacter butzleri TaxID=28197 RepID=UPI0021B530F4|nr:hypothetical protein [Aliarcobacter butzleri]MCT7643479.1 hypothetical protein [Aliarcobacter butzleri]